MPESDGGVLLTAISLVIGFSVLCLGIMVVWVRVFNDSLIMLRNYFLGLSLRFFSNRFANNMLSRRFGAYLAARSDAARLSILKELVYALASVDSIPARDFSLMLERLFRDFAMSLAREPFGKAVGKLKEISDIINS